MPYRFKSGDRSVQAGLRRIAVEQLKRAVDEIDDGSLDADETVHQVRKRCKKVRGLIRLVRPVFDDYGAENRMLRDAARGLSTMRDAVVIGRTYDRLTNHFGDQIEQPAFASVRRRLTPRRQAANAGTDPEAMLGEAREALAAAKDRAAGWKIDKAGYKAVAGGLGKTYGRARKAMAEAWRQPASPVMHEWRKQAKYHWYHACLLEPIRPAMMAPQVEALDQLADLLGDHHDLAVLAETIKADPDEFGSQNDLEALSGLILGRQEALAREAFGLGRVALAERKGALVERWGAYWKAWHEGDVGPSDTVLRR